MAKRIGDIIEFTEVAVRAELVASDWESAAAYCLGQLERGMPPSTEERMHRFFVSLWFLEHPTKLSTTKTVPYAVEACEGLLDACDIRPGISKYSGLYARVYVALSQWTGSNGDPWLAMWQTNIARFLTRVGGQDMSAAELLLGANHAYALGHVLSASGAYFYAEEHAVKPEMKAEACLGRIRCLRMMGETHHAKTAAAGAAVTYAEVSEFKTAIAWQERLCDYQLTDDFNLLMVAWSRDSEFFQARYALTASILGHARLSGDKSRIRRSSTFKKIDFPEQIQLGSDEFSLLKLLQILEGFDGLQAEPTEKMHDLGKFMAKFRASAPIDDQALCLAAVARRLDENKQDTFLGMIIAEFVGLSLKAANGRSRDPLNLLPDLLDKGEIVQASRYRKTLSELPITGSARLLKLSLLISRATFMSAKAKFGSLFASASKKTAVAEEFSIELIDFIIDGIGHMKGPIMKVGQLIVATNSVPVEAKRRIQRALINTRQVDLAQMHAVFKAEHGKMPWEVFKNWNDEVIGIGSIAQVFKAELPDGSPVAVKIMYPGLAQAIEADMRFLALTKPLMRVLFPALKTNETFGIHFDLYVGECDLKAEAVKHQQWYDLFAGREGVIVPKVYQEYSSKSVLVADFIKGQKVYEFSQGVSYEDRKIFARKVWDIMVEGVAVHGLAHLDPHAGNFLRCGEDVAFIDFGSLYQVTPTTAQQIGEFSVPLQLGDVEGVYRSLERQGMINTTVLTPEVWQEIAPIVMSKWHPQFDRSLHHISKLSNPAYRNYVRHGFTMSPEFTHIYLALMLFYATEEAIMGDTRAELLLPLDETG